jgi:hypothetical protein
MSSADLLALQRDSLSESNRGLFDSIQALKAKQEAEAVAAQAAAEVTRKAQEVAAAIANERNGLQDEYNRLTMSSADLLALQRDSLSESNRGLFDSIQALKAKQEAEAVAAQAAAEVTRKAQEVAAAIANERNGLQDEYNRLTMSSTELLALQRDSLSESNRGLFDSIQAIKAKQEAEVKLKSTRETAYSALQRSINAEKSRIDVIRSAAQESVNSITGIFSLLRDQSEQLYGSVESTRTMQASAGNAFIDKALANFKTSGYLPDQAQLAEAIASARLGISSSQYESKFEADKAALTLAGKLSQLREIAAPQLSVAELALKTANDQLTALDAQITFAQKQLDAVNGVNLSVLSVEAAMQGLTAALQSQSSTVESTPATVVGFDAGISYVPPTSSVAAAGADNSVRLERLVEGLTVEVKRLQDLLSTSNQNTRRTADAVNGNQDLPTLVKVV